MKSLSLFSISSLIFFAIISCKKNSVSDAGYNIKKEPVNITEITNGHQYSFSNINFATTPEIALQIKTAIDTANCSIWSIYLVSTNGTKYLISGSGKEGASYYYTHRYYSQTGGKLNIIITKTSGTGEEYASVLIRRLNWR
jgi:hypothetical protein